ncbi:MarR family winged helix-turn-helix transcriptional regulator [Sphingobium nicotianae]|uniref:MarR family transcriptional regulator n=1 Tax=Sphingobium nicotianae TaxID=2782607 RepID=A0A9X1DDI5_9SPHN|nr:MarR family transcriptional regulator [Sphingobium nicotianae]MBT2188048.1 MarR family transcriptional regulator [Sphingobium nicotianae]
MTDNTAIKMADEETIFGNILPAREGYPAPELGLTIAIILAGRRWRSLLDEKLRTLGHSASRMEAMSAIAYAPAHTTQIQIAKRVGIEGPTLTRTLDMLEADGLVERLPDPSDRRNKHMKLTPAGFEALGEMLAVTGALRAKLLENVPMTDVRANLGFLSMLLERIEGGLETPDD